MSDGKTSAIKENPAKLVKVHGYYAGHDHRETSKGIYNAIYVDTIDGESIEVRCGDRALEAKITNKFANGDPIAIEFQENLEGKTNFLNSEGKLKPHSSTHNLLVNAQPATEKGIRMQERNRTMNKVMNEDISDGVRSAIAQMSSGLYM